MKTRNGILGLLVVAAIALGSTADDLYNAPTILTDTATDYVPVVRVTKSLRKILISRLGHGDSVQFAQWADSCRYCTGGSGGVDSGAVGALIGDSLTANNHHWITSADSVRASHIADTAKVAGSIPYSGATNSVPKWDGTKFVQSFFSDNGSQAYVSALLNANAVSANRTTVTQSGALHLGATNTDWGLASLVVQGQSAGDVGTIGLSNYGPAGTRIGAAIYLDTLTGYLRYNRENGNNYTIYDSGNLPTSIDSARVSGLSDSAKALIRYSRTTALHDTADTLRQRIADTSGVLRDSIAVKEPAIAAGTTAQYWRGDKTWQTLPTSLPPSGPAGGDLAGTYPNPVLNTIGPTGTWGQVTTDSKGRVTSGTTVEDVGHGGTGQAGFSYSYALPYCPTPSSFGAVAPNTSTTRMALTMTGTGTAGAAPAWNSLTYSDLTGTIPTWNQNTTGSAAKWTNGRIITIGSTGKTVDGSGNVSWSLAEIGAQAAGSYQPLENQRLSTTNNPTFAGLTSSATVNLTGFGTGTFNKSVIYSDANGVYIERQRATDASGGTIMPFGIGQRGGDSSTWAFTVGASATASRQAFYANASGTAFSAPNGDISTGGSNVNGVLVKNANYTILSTDPGIILNIATGTVTTLPASDTNGKIRYIMSSATSAVNYVSSTNTIAGGANTSVTGGQGTCWIFYSGVVTGWFRIL